MHWSGLASTPERSTGVSALGGKVLDVSLEESDAEDALVVGKDPSDKCKPEARRVLRTITEEEDSSSVSTLTLKMDTHIQDSSSNKENDLPRDGDPPQPAQATVEVPMFSATTHSPLRNNKLRL